ncbi:50S ribosomal protein L9 [uncultured Nisaea sp.]|jgi:large subunit ribosomal protein L9|uniref:50S ribosomal protein L9 n=1 Tax=uncultured Nisaea sp. TaxID=538215 RepID=UPI0030ECB376|tara:strand:- start:7932 stop:8525 length:594 start_codon:yes stop_codon:yes gene_type:complete
MEVILLERIERLGQMGDVVTVKPGFARNFLLPQGKALRANKSNLTHFEGQRAQLEAENLDRKAEAEQVAKKLDGLVVPIIRAAGDSGQLYGSVTSRDIAEATTAEGVTISKRQVVLDRALKVLGLEEIRVVLHPEVTVNITVNIARSTDEAEQQKLLGRAVGSEENDFDDEDEVEAAPAATEEVAEEAAEEEKTEEA